MIFKYCPLIHINVILHCKSKEIKDIKKITIRLIMNKLSVVLMACTMSVCVCSTANAQVSAVDSVMTHAGGHKVKCRRIWRGRLQQKFLQ